MATLMRMDPAREMLSLREAMDRLFEESYLRPGLAASGAMATSGPVVDMYETDHQVVVQATVPGVKPEDIKVTVTGDLLTIAGEFKAETSKQDEKRNYVRQERRYGSFSRQLSLPAGVNADGCSATFENGVLTLELPKVEQEKTKTVRVVSKNQEVRNG